MLGRTFNYLFSVTRILLILVNVLNGIYLAKLVSGTGSVGLILSSTNFMVKPWKKPILTNEVKFILKCRK